MDQNAPLPRPSCATCSHDYQAHVQIGVRGSQVLGVDVMGPCQWVTSEGMWRCDCTEYEPEGLGEYEEEVS